MMTIYWLRQLRGSFLSMSVAINKERHTYVLRFVRNYNFADFVYLHPLRCVHITTGHVTPCLYLSLPRRGASGDDRLVAASRDGSGAVWRDVWEQTLTVIGGGRFDKVNSSASARETRLGRWATPGPRSGRLDRVNWLNKVVIKIMCVIYDCFFPVFQLIFLLLPYTVMYINILSFYLKIIYFCLLLLIIMDLHNIILCIISILSTIHFKHCKVYYIIYPSVCASDYTSPFSTKFNEH